MKRPLGHTLAVILAIALLLMTQTTAIAQESAGTAPTLQEKLALAEETPAIAITSMEVVEERSIDPAEMAARENRLQEEQRLANVEALKKAKIISVVDATTGEELDARPFMSFRAERMPVPVEKRLPDTAPEETADPTEEVSAEDNSTEEESIDEDSVPSEEEDETMGEEPMEEEVKEEPAEEETTGEPIEAAAETDFVQAAGPSGAVRISAIGLGSGFAEPLPLGQEIPILFQIANQSSLTESDIYVEVWFDGTYAGGFLFGAMAANTTVTGGIGATFAYGAQHTVEFRLNNGNRLSRTFSFLVSTTNSADFGVSNLREATTGGRVLSIPGRTQMKVDIFNYGPAAANYEIRVSSGGTVLLAGAGSLQVPSGVGVSVSLGLEVVADTVEMPGPLQLDVQVEPTGGVGDLYQMNNQTSTSFSLTSNPFFAGRWSSADAANLRVAVSNMVSSAHPGVVGLFDVYANYWDATAPNINVSVSQEVGSNPANQEVRVIDGSLQDVFLGFAYFYAEENGQGRIEGMDLYFDTSTYVSAEIAINPSAWESSDLLQAVAVHEMGHVFGLAHLYGHQNSIMAVPAIPSIKVPTSIDTNHLNDKY